VSDARPIAQASHAAQSLRLPLAFWALLALTAGVRVLGISRPLLGNFATKSVVYAMIGRNWVEGRAGILYPTLDCLVGGKRSLHMLEFPVSACLTGWLWKAFGGSLDVWGRAVSVAFSVASVALLYLFVRRRHGATAALGAGSALALSPISVVYGQSFMLEPSLVFFTVATFYSVDRWLAARHSGWLPIAITSFALLLLTKVYMLVLLLPLAWSVFCSNRLPLGRSVSELPRRRIRGMALFAAVLAMVPAVLWYAHAARTAASGGPSTAPVYFSLQRSAATHCPPDPLLWTPDFYRQLLDDLTGVVLTPVGFALVLAGFLDRAWREHAPWLLATAILVAALPLKFYQMNYYYMAVLPPVCIMAGLGWQVVCDRLRPGRTATGGLLLAALVFSTRYAAKPAFVTPEDDRAVVAAGRAIQELTDAEEPVVTMHGTAIDLLYYSNRPGWAVAPDTPDLASVLEECRRQGARYLVVAGPDAVRRPDPLQAHATVVRGDGFCIHQLTSARHHAG